MMDQIPSINIPVDTLKSVIDEQKKLRQEINANNKDRCDLKNHVANLVKAAAVLNAEKSSSMSSKSNSSSSSSETSKTIKTVESIQDIPESIPDDSKIPSIEEFVAMSDEGKINITDELLKELYTANSRIDAVNEVGSKLQKRWCELDITVENIKREINNIRSDINNIKQYLKIDNLLLHRFRLPYNKLSSLEFVKYVANQINNLLPNLPVPVSVHDISTAHPLPTKAKKSNVVVVRFCKRHIKDMIFESRHLVGHGVLITEHLTDHTLGIVKKAEELFGRHYVHTESCKVLINCENKFILVKSVEEVHKLYAKFCEHIGDNIHTFTEPTTIAHNYHHSYNSNTYNYHRLYNYRHPSYSDSVKNSQHNGQRLQSQRGRNTYYRRKPSTGYSVRNRVY